MPTIKCNFSCNNSLYYFKTNMSSVLSLARARVEDSLTTSQVRHVQLINDQQTVSHESFLNLAPTHVKLCCWKHSRLWICLFLCVHLFTLAPLYASSFYPLMLNCLLFFFFFSLVFFLKKKDFWVLFFG